MEETKLIEKFEQLHAKFVANQVNKIQRYLANNRGLDPIEGKKPMSKYQVREFVTRRWIENDRTMCRAETTKLSLPPKSLNGPKTMGSDTNNKIIVRANAGER